LKIGLGIEPSSLSQRTHISKMPTTPIMKRKTTKPLNILLPAVLSYSKPKLKPRLNKKDFETTTPFTVITTAKITISSYINIETTPSIMFRVKNLTKLTGNTADETVNVIESFNNTFNNSSQMTLFDFSVNLYQNEYIQKVVNGVIKNNVTLDWNFITGKLKIIGVMIIEVLIIGMRYYPLMNILENKSCTCLFFASIYIWLDLLYNVGLIGLCEGLRLNVSFSLLKELRRVFGVGFLMDIKESIKYKPISQEDSNNKNNVQFDAEFLFSINRITYSLFKSLPHFFCLSYLATCLTLRFIIRFFKLLKSNFFEKRNAHNYDQTCVIASCNKTDKYSLVYQKYTRNKNNRNKRKNFEDSYVSNLLKNSEKDKKSSKCCWSWDQNFRFSTRIICTYTVCFTILFYLTCFIIFYGIIFVDLLYLPHIYKYILFSSALTSSLVCFVQLILSLNQFKIHLKMLYKGKNISHMCNANFYSNNKLAMNSFNYAGYAVTYTCWGYIIIFLIIAFSMFQLTTLFVFGGSTVFILILVILCPFLFYILIMKLFNYCMSSFLSKIWLKKHKSRFALKNLKLFGLLFFLKFCYDCFTGLAFCLFRILRSMFISIIFMQRVDYSLMGRSFEKMDSAYMSYVGYLHMEANHTNPILISFSNTLKRELKLRNRSFNYSMKAIDCLKKQKARNRWFLFYSLIKNRQLISLRRK
jgi:hypothetical protein